MKIRKRAYIYVLSFPNGKNYVGRWTASLHRLTRRYSFVELSGDRLVNRAIRRYGWESVHLVIAERLKDVTDEEINAIEDFHIVRLNSLVVANGYNVALGGDVFTHNPDRQQIVENIKVRLRKSHPRSGTHHSERTKRIIGSKAKGRAKEGRHPRLGAVLSEETKRRIGDAQKGRTAPIETRKRIDDSILKQLVSGETTYRRVMTEQLVSQRVIEFSLLMRYGSKNLRECKLSVGTGLIPCSELYELLIGKESQRKLMKRLNVTQRKLRKSLLFHYGTKKATDVQKVQEGSSYCGELFS